MKHPIDGILLVDKEESETSSGVVRRVKKAFGSPSQRLRVGHAGTLDPFATGLLIILLGQGTKLSRFIMSVPKVYEAVLTLGVETDTLDPTGRVVHRKAVPILDPLEIQRIAAGFVGEVVQTPPAFSALKHQGVRAYHLARRCLPVHLDERVVRIYDLRVLAVAMPDVTVLVNCSAGTYVRSLGADLAGKLGTVGHISYLRRWKIGDFDVNQALPSQAICREASSLLAERILDLREALPHMPEIRVDQALAERVRQGYQPLRRELLTSAEATEPPFPGGEDGATRAIPLKSKDFGRSHGQGMQPLSRHFKLISGGKLVAIMEGDLMEEEGYEQVKVTRVFLEA